MVTYWTKLYLRSWIIFVDYTINCWYFHIKSWRFHTLSAKSWLRIWNFLSFCRRKWRGNYLDWLLYQSWIISWTLLSNNWYSLLLSWSMWAFWFFDIKFRKTFVFLTSWVWFGFIFYLSWSYKLALSRSRLQNHSY